MELLKTGVMTASSRPSPLRSPRLTVPGPVGKEMLCGVKPGLAAPSFSYQVTTDDMGAKEKRSGWPSPLMSPTVMDWAFQLLLVMVWRTQVLPSPVEFSHQLRSPKPEETMSSLPSPFMSWAKAMRTSPKGVPWCTTCRVHVPSKTPGFSHHWMLPSPEEMTSSFPSPFISPTLRMLIPPQTTETARLLSVSDTASVREKRLPYEMSLPATEPASPKAGV